MDIRLVDERILVLPDRLDLASAEALAAPRQTDAFGTLAKMAGLLSRAKPEDIELAYKERRLQPFWGLSCTSVCAYERTRGHALKLPPEVVQIAVAGETQPVNARQATIQVLETCRDEVRKEAVFDALTGQPAADVSAAVRSAARQVSEDELSSLIREDTVLVPPKAKAAVVIRDLLAGLRGKIDADRLTEETVAFDAIDLYYRPVYAFRYRRAGKEAVVEVDGVTGEVKLGGATFEALLGKMLEPRFLLEVGAETVNLFIPGATLVRVLVSKGMDMRERR